MLRRDDALRAIIPHINETDIVVAVYQSCFDWIELCPRDLNYVAVGAMGQASSHGLGLALANPDRRIIVLDGDGSLLMNLGSLVTISGANVKNLYHFLSANRIYEVNGAHPIPGSKKVNFSALAKAAGYNGSHSFNNLEEFSASIKSILKTPGPQFISMELISGKPFPENYNYIHSREAREKFERALK